MTVSGNIDCVEPATCAKSFRSYLKLCQDIKRDETLLKLSYTFNLSWNKEDLMWHKRMACRTNDEDFYLWFFDKFETLYRIREQSEFVL